MTGYFLPGAPGDIERQVTDLLNLAQRTGRPANELVVAAARTLCLLAFSARPAGMTRDEVRQSVMTLVWESLTPLERHPFASNEPGH